MRCVLAATSFPKISNENGKTSFSIFFQKLNKSNQFSYTNGVNFRLMVFSF